MEFVLGMFAGVFFLILGTPLGVLVERARRAKELEDRNAP